MRGRLQVLVALGCVLGPLAGPAVAAPEQSSITLARAKDLAKAGVLKGADLPGFSAEAQAADPSDAADERAYFACVGAKAPTYAARNLGTAFTKGVLEIDSSADVASSTAAAKAHMKAFKSPKAAACTRKLLVRVLERQGATVESISVKKVAVTVPGADAAVAFRLHAVASAHGVTIHLTGLDVFARVGRTEITVSPGRFDDTQPSLKRAESLAKVAAKRVRAV